MFEKRIACQGCFHIWPCRWHWWGYHRCLGDSWLLWIPIISPRAAIHVRVCMCDTVPAIGWQSYAVISCCEAGKRLKNSANWEAPENALPIECGGEYLVIATAFDCIPFHKMAELSRYRLPSSYVCYVQQRSHEWHVVYSSILPLTLRCLSYCS